MEERKLRSADKAGSDLLLPKLLKAADVAEILGIVPKTVHKLVREGKLGCVQVTERDRRFTEEQAQEYIRSKTVPAPIDNEQQRRLKSPPPKGGEKSLRDSDKADLWKEIRSWQ